MFDALKTAGKMHETGFQISCSLMHPYTLTCTTTNRTMAIIAAQHD